MFHVKHLDETTSTNDEIKRALEAGEPEGLVVRARRQTGGYGRQGRTWASPEGGLYCSLLLRPDVSPAQLPTLSLVVGLVVRRALVQLAPHAANAIQVKWPNDVVLVGDSCSRDGFSKLCGISLEKHAAGVCVGVGVNVVPPDKRPDVGGKNQPTYLVDIAPQFTDAPTDEILNAVFDAFAAAFSLLYEQWIADGFAPLLDEFNRHAALAGRTVTMVDREGTAQTTGHVEGVDEFGRLLLQTLDGLVPVASGEAHL